MSPEQFKALEPGDIIQYYRPPNILCKYVFAVIENDGKSIKAVGTVESDNPEEWLLIVKKSDMPMERKQL